LSSLAVSQFTRENLFISKNVDYIIIQLVSAFQAAAMRLMDWIVVCVLQIYELEECRSYLA